MIEGNRAALATVLRPLRGRIDFTDDVTGGVASLNPRLMAATPPGSNFWPVPNGALECSIGHRNRPAHDNILDRCLFSLSTARPCPDSAADDRAGGRASAPGSRHLPLAAGGARAGARGCTRTVFHDSRAGPDEPAPGAPFCTVRR